MEVAKAADAQLVAQSAHVGYPGLVQPMPAAGVQSMQKQLPAPSHLPPPRNMRVSGPHSHQLNVRPGALPAAGLALPAASSVQHEMALEEGRLVGAGQAVHYTSKFLQHRRHMQLHKAYVAQ